MSYSQDSQLVSDNIPCWNVQQVEASCMPGWQKERLKDFHRLGNVWIASVRPDEATQSTLYGSTMHRPGSNGACASGSRRSGWSTPQLVRKVDHVASYLCMLEQSHVPLKPRLMLDN